MLSDGLDYPKRGDDAVITIVIGSLLSFFSWTLITALPLLGYFVRVLRETIRGNEEPPEYDDWGDLFVTGVLALGISLVYSIVPFVLLGIILVVLTAVLGVGFGAEAGIVGLLISLFVFVLAAIPVALLVYYVVPAALAAYADTGSVGAAFSPGGMADVLLSLEYLTASLLPILLAVVVSVINTFLAATVVGLVVAIPLQYYVTVAVFRMFGTAYRDVKGTAAPVDSGTATPA